MGPQTYRRTWSGSAGVKASRRRVMLLWSDSVGMALFGAVRAAAQPEAAQMMTFALWMILVAAVLPFLSVGIAKFGGAGYDNAAPRRSLEALRGWRARADWAHRNHIEAFAPFAAAVLVAHWAHAPQAWVNGLAGAFILLRVAYTAAYVFDRPSLRSLLFGLGFACVLGLFLRRVAVAPAWWNITEQVRAGDGDGCQKADCGRAGAGRLRRAAPPGRRSRSSAVPAVPSRTFSRTRRRAAPLPPRNSTPRPAGWASPRSGRRISARSASAAARRSALAAARTGPSPPPTPSPPPSSPGRSNRYDDAFGLCMFARGNQLPGYGPLAVLQPASAAPSSVVQAVQAELNRLGYMAGPADGVAGPQTVAAISYFERANGLPVDNAASPGLLERLRRMP